MKGNKKILFIYLIVFFSSLYGLYFYKNIFSSSIERDGKLKIASIIKLKNIVKFKDNQKLNWMNTSNETFFLNDDRIFTGKDSTISIKTNSGNIIDILELSLIKLKTDSMSLDKGNVTAFLNKRMIIFVNGQKALLLPSKKSKISITKTKEGSNIVTVEEGEVILDFGGQKIILKNGQSSKINLQGTISRHGLENINLTLNLIDNYIQCSKGNLTLSWKSKVDVDKYIISVYSNSNHSQKVSEHITKTNNLSLNISKFISDLYINIIGIKNKREVSQLQSKHIQKVDITNFDRIRLSKQKVIVGENLKILSDFDINKTLNDINYSILLKNNKSKKYQKLNDNIVYTDKLLPGLYSVHYCFINSSCFAKPICSSETFNLIDTNKPSLIFPRNTDLIYTDTAQLQVKFKWSLWKLNKSPLKLNLLNGNEKMSVNIDKNNSFDKILEPGTYSWNLEGATNGIKFKTRTESFEIQKLKIITNLKSNFIKFNPNSMNIDFSWDDSNKDTLNTYLEYEIKGVSSQTKINRKNTKIKLNTPLSSFVKWRLLKKDGIKLVSKSKWATFSAPSCKNYKAKKLGVVNYGTDTPIFEWPVVSGAHYYKLKVFKFGHLEKTDSYNFKVYKNFYKWKSFSKKILNWTVTPVDSTGNECPTMAFGKYKR